MGVVFVMCRCGAFDVRVVFVMCGCGVCDVGVVFVMWMWCL